MTMPKAVWLDEVWKVVDKEVTEIEYLTDTDFFFQAENALSEQEMNPVDAANAIIKLYHHMKLNNLSTFEETIENYSQSN